MRNWKSANPDLVKEVLREGEVYLQGQLTLATSADQRAAVLGGIYTAAAAAIIAGLIAALATGQISAAISVGGILSAGLFLIAAGLCISTVLPADFYLPGNHPESWYEDIDANRDLLESLGEEAEHYQGSINKNRTFLKRNAGRFRWGAISGLAAPIVGFASWFMLSVDWTTFGAG